MNIASLTRAADIIRAGGVVAYPTEACFGLGCDPRNIFAVRRILRMKRRARAQGVILIADHRARLMRYANFSALRHRKPMFDSWPGKHTWLVPATGGVSRWVRGEHSTVAVRVTAHRDAAMLCRLAHTALVSTSANRHGRRMLTNTDAVLREFGDEVDFVVDGKVGGARTPSVIRDAQTGKVVRG